MINFVRGLPMTRIKIFLAGVLYRFIKPFMRKRHYIVTRKGIRYELDLSELIDLSIFVLGAFQRHITAGKYFTLPDNAIIVDVGANIGSMTLPFAGYATRGKVYALEPADEAYKKLLQNLELNPELSRRIKPCRLLAADKSLPTSDCNSVYASWKVDGKNKINRHLIHGGLKASISPVEQITIDDFCQNYDIKTVDLIKIDTDGSEFNILKGCRGILTDFRPILIFEIGQYLMEENNLTFNDYYSLLSPFGYSMINSKNNRHIIPDNCHQQIPLRATIDIIALPPPG